MKILVLFVEPMLYGMDLIHEVYEKTKHDFMYLYCTTKLTGKDYIVLPENSVVLSGTKMERRIQVNKELFSFSPDFVIINGYVGIEQVTAIRYCQKKHIPYAIETDTPLHIPANPIVAFAKRMLLWKRLHHSCCYGFPGGTLQKENLIHYGIPEKKNYIMPMSVSEVRLLKVANSLPNREELKKEFGFSSKKIILFVGRLAPEKNVSLLIKAFHELSSQYNDIALLIVGDGSEREKLQIMVKEGNIQNVHFVGYVLFPEIVQYYKMADYFVLPSVYESWGLVVNEAMIMGLPVVVSSNVGCRADLIQDGQNGFVFENENVKSLVENIKYVLQSNYIMLSNSSKEMIDGWNYLEYRKRFIEVVTCIQNQEMLED